eukprot:CAMPEP_0177649880 /NCGR_PEP_ID=MMETSP0447-20121125/11633_1 /TAXON_ID=0 /ORGANISM="Stygamoeba regulata, Strain BSH-02190019" /LENGTH=99 /DNA_ID=CAMNT_0019152689 /DNA_START=142 /DNA_END=441 /DNA_ORIENTATION=+
MRAEIHAGHLVPLYLQHLLAPPPPDAPDNKSTDGSPENGKHHENDDNNDDGGGVDAVVLLPVAVGGVAVVALVPFLAHARAQRVTTIGICKLNEGEAHN